MLVKSLTAAAFFALPAYAALTGFPEGYKVPEPKPEWLELIKNANISNAPVLKNEPGVGPVQPSNVQGDPSCVWTFTECLRPEDVYTCPKGTWSVTYDDGPSEFSPLLYDYLDKVNQKVTFFMVGTQIVQYPELAKRAYEAGHEIAMHSWSHSYMTTLTNEQVVAELKWNELAIKEATGYSPKYFRPPFGNIDNRVRDICKALGFTRKFYLNETNNIGHEVITIDICIAVIWDHDTFDWRLTENSGFQQSWISGNVSEWANTAQGGMSLQHDLYNETVHAAIDIFPILQEKFQLKLVRDCDPHGNASTSANTTTASPSASQPANSSPAAASASSSASSSASVAAANANAENAASGRFIVSSGLGLLLAAVAAISVA